MLKILLSMYALGSTVLKDIHLKNEKNQIIEKFETVNLKDELNAENEQELYILNTIYKKSNLLKTLELISYNECTNFVLINELLNNNEYIEKENVYKDLMDDWDFTF